MKGSNYNITDFDDLVFEFRNRDYGAYQLRKKYNLSLISGIVIATIIACCVVIIPSLDRKKPDFYVAGGRGSGYVPFQMDDLEPPEEELYIPPAPPPPRGSERMEEVVRYVPPVVVDTLITFETTLITTDEVLNQSGDDPIDIAGSGFGDDLFGGEGGVKWENHFYS